MSGVYRTAGPGDIAQHELLNLPRGCLRQLPEHERLGRLEARHVLRQKSQRASAVTLAPGFSSTKAHGVSPHVSSGCATTAALSTAGWLNSTSSTSIDEMFSPRK